MVKAADQQDRPLRPAGRASLKDARRSSSRAGRRPIGEKRMESSLHVRMSKELIDACRAQGGGSFVREVIGRHFETAAKAAAAAADCSAQPLLEKIAAGAGVSIPEAAMSAPCGFPSPASDYAEEELDIVSYLIPHPTATFAATARGDSMVDAGILDGDKLFVDRSLTPRRGDIVLAWVNGGHTVKLLRFAEDGTPELHPANDEGNYPVIRADILEDLLIEGVVVSLGRRIRH